MLSLFDSKCRLWSSQIEGDYSKAIKLGFSITKCTTNGLKPYISTHPLAACRPKPLDPPVTTATFPSTEKMLWKLSSLTCSAADILTVIKTSRGTSCFSFWCVCTLYVCTLLGGDDTIYSFRLQGGSTTTCILTEVQANDNRGPRIGSFG